jgi:hypothetical protein
MLSHFKGKFDRQNKLKMKTTNSENYEEKGNIISYIALLIFYVYGIVIVNNLT